MELSPENLVGVKQRPGLGHLSLAERGELGGHPNAPAPAFCSLYQWSNCLSATVSV